jgi:hypothetical protein
MSSADSGRPCDEIHDDAGGAMSAIGNREFLEALFAEALPGAFTIVCSFPGDPYEADRTAWFGRPWAPGQQLPSHFDKGNTYLTVSTFEPDPLTGELRRRKANFVAMHAVMIDDIGTKVHREKVLLEPSAMIETSPGNFQAYLFLRQEDGSTRDQALCERLIERMVAAGLTGDRKDPGMKGVTRYGRLPVGINGKGKYVVQLGRAPPTRCVLFEPARQFTIAEIAGAWRLDLTPLRPRAPVIPITQARAVRTAGRFSALLKTFELMDMYRGRIGNGPWHAIRCPWVHTHTEEVESGTAVADPSADNNHSGGFRCHHGHCDARTMADVWRWVRALSIELDKRERR